MPGRVEPIWVSVEASGKVLNMELDTGASVSLISEETYRRTWRGWTTPMLKTTNKRLKTYTGDTIQVVGEIQVQVGVNNTGQKVKLSMLVVRGKGSSLLGRDGLQQLILDWHQIFRVRDTPRPAEVVTRHQALFQKELGEYMGPAAAIVIDPNETQRFCKAGSVSYALRQRVDDQLKKIEAEGILRPVEHATWAAPIVPVVKPDRSIHICGDFKQTVNRAAQLDTYPVPKVEDILAKLSQGNYFSKLDLSHAYNQFPLSAESQKYTTINTQRGLSSL